MGTDPIEPIFRLITAKCGEFTAEYGGFIVETHRFLRYNAVVLRWK